MKLVEFLMILIGISSSYGGVKWLVKTFVDLVFLAILGSIQSKKKPGHVRPRAMHPKKCTRVFLFLVGFQAVSKNLAISNEFASLSSHLIIAAWSQQPLVNKWTSSLLLADNTHPHLMPLILSSSHLNKKLYFACQRHKTRTAHMSFHTRVSFLTHSWQLLPYFYDFMFFQILKW
jgi:hypothetical protein